MSGRIPYGISPLTKFQITIWLLILFIPQSGRAQGESTMPLAVGNSWSYESEAGGLTVTVAETVTIRERATYRVVFDRGLAANYEEFLSWNDRGQLLLHARKTSGASQVVFEPPLVWFTPGGHEGVGGEVHLYAEAKSTAPPTDGVYYVAFMGDEIISTPGGNYHALHVDELNSEGEARWYSADVGLVQLRYPDGGGHTYVLVLPDLAVGVEDSSWSHVKALYR